MNHTQCKKTRRWPANLGIAALALGVGVALWSGVASAQEAEAVPATAEQVKELLGTPKVIADTLWVMITGMLVFFMNLGFAMVESGLCRAKNAVNILAKNFVVFAVSSLAFLFIGWGLMFGDGNSFVGTSGLFFVGGLDNSPASGDAYSGVYTSIAWATVPLWVKFFFQLVFAGTAATIVSGAVAERIKFLSFVLFSFVIVGLIYPVTGHWIWGGGWLASMGFWDFAGSTVVHSVGGWAALAGVIALGPRIGKFSKDGRPMPLPGHSMTSATIGVFVLWLGWFGFNPGSTMAGDALAIGHIAVTTNTAAAAATLSAVVASILLLGKPDLSMILNGCLAGLVAITAGCAWVSVGSSLLIGLIAGAIVVVAVLAFDKAKLDDPVGALSVHLACGVFGTLAVGLFADSSAAPVAGPANGLFFGGGFTQLWAQTVGVVAVGGYTFVVSMVAWMIIKAVMGLRVSAEEEIEGLDVGEHGNSAYPDFQQVSISGTHLPTGSGTAGGSTVYASAALRTESAQ
ncbi:MAG: ammonium transporter [Candidatus Binatia bacterium]